MTAHIPIRFASTGTRDVPVVDLALKVRGSSARIHEFALVDTGSHETVLPQGLMAAHGFPVHRASPSEGGIHGLGGNQASKLLPEAVIALRDTDGAFYPANLPHVHLVPVDIPPIVGRDILEALDAVLTIDFRNKRGHLEVG